MGRLILGVDGDGNPRELRVDGQGRVEISGGAYNLKDLDDVAITDPQDGDTLVYDADAQKWINGAGGGGDYVPYTGANQSVDLGEYSLTASNLTGGFVKSNGELQVNTSLIWDRGGNSSPWEITVTKSQISLAWGLKFTASPYPGVEFGCVLDVGGISSQNAIDGLAFWVSGHLNSGGGINRASDVGITMPIADKSLLSYDVVDSKWKNTRDINIDSITVGEGNPTWQLGSVHQSEVNVDPTQYVEVKIDGQTVKLAVVQEV